MKLLIADDDKTFCHLLSAEMSAKGWRVTIAADAMQTIMYARRVQPDVIVLDIQMPGGTGITALEKLKASTKAARIPVRLRALTYTSMYGSLTGQSVDNGAVHSQRGQRLP